MENCICTVDDVLSFNFDNVHNDQFWDSSEEKELKIHRIHAYPAKFPALIAEKAIKYARENNHVLKNIADIFCGCGTVAFEAKKRNINFWGCDINPVATLIAKTKSHTYKKDKLNTYYNKIILTYNGICSIKGIYKNANERLKYWYYEQEYNNLIRLKESIEVSVPKSSSYRLFFFCAFSNILKATSRWLTKSIKPQRDPNKVPVNVIEVFKQQYHFMLDAYCESLIKNESMTNIITGNFLDNKVSTCGVDMIITSPPYVTSYEYADLHQLSALWLDYASDYRNLRPGSIGSMHHDYHYEKEYNNLNLVGKSVVSKLIKKDKSQGKAVAKYYLDMQDVVKKCKTILNRKGLALFVIGDTEYKGVRIENARHILEALVVNEFKDITIIKRRITGKILTPYRDSRGRFTTDSKSRKVYNEEYIIIGKKMV